MDSFVPVLSVERCEDMFDFRMIILRLGSAAAIFYGAQEFLKDPANLEDFLSGGGEILDEVYDWGHNKFMGIADNSTQIEVKKSARQIYAEAFMDDENDVFKTSTRFVEYADEDAVKEANEEFKRRFADDGDDEDDEDAEEVDLDAKDESKQADEEEEEEDILDKLTGNVDEDEEDQETEASTEEASSDL